MSIAHALEVSCNTVFFGLAYNMYVNEGGLERRPERSRVLDEHGQELGYGRHDRDRPAR